MILLRRFSLGLLSLILLGGGFAGEFGGFFGGQFGEPFGELFPSVWGAEPLSPAPQTSQPTQMPPAPPTPQTAKETVKIRLEKTAEYRHAADAYCQGLIYEADANAPSGILYESAGRYGESTLRRVDLKTGRVLQKIRLKREFFAEGAAVVGDKIYQLTWKENICFVYDKKTLKRLDQFRYEGEGWGLAYDGTHLILSDGSSRLSFYDPETFQKIKTVRVFYEDPKTGEKSPIAKLNELEFIDGEIWANVYQSPYILRIDPETGNVRQIFNLTSLIPPKFRGDNDAVLNGIAWDPVRRKIYLTGKDWPVLYEMSLIRDSAASGASDASPSPSGRP